MIEAFLVGVSGHDHRHPGSTHLPPEEVSKQLPYRSVEGRSAYYVDKWLKEKGYHPLYRLMALYPIAASTFGGKEIGIDFDPRSFLGLLMRAVDVLPSKDPVNAIHEDVGVLYGENPANPPPSNREEYFKNREKFLDYVELTLNKLNSKEVFEGLKRFLPEERIKKIKGTITSHFDWDERIKNARKLLERARDDRSPEAMILRSTLRHTKKEYEHVPEV